MSAITAGEREATALGRAEAVGGRALLVVTRGRGAGAAAPDGIEGLVGLRAACDGGDRLLLLADEPQLAGRQRVPARRREWAGRAGFLGAGLGDRGDALRGLGPGAEEVVVEERVLGRLQLGDVGFLVLAAHVTVVEEEERDVRVRVLAVGPVVEADRLVGREEVVGPAVGDQERRRWLRV